MNALLRNTLAVGAVVFATQAAAQITFYAQEGFAGQSVTTQQSIDNLERIGFNDRASSVVVVGDRWEVCEHAQFGGRCVVLRPGRYPSLAPMGLNGLVSSVRDVGRDARTGDNRYGPAAVTGQITFYEHEGFAGRSFGTDQPVVNFESNGFNDRASSIVVSRDRWEVCDGAQFAGRCIVLGPGSYPSLASLGLNDRVSSAREVGRNTRIDDNRYANVPVAGQITFYEQEEYTGRSFTTDQPVDNFSRFGFNDRAASVVVAGERWEVCEHAQFGGRCVVLRPGRYPSLASIGLDARISSVRNVGRNARMDNDRYPPAATGRGGDWRRRND